MTKVIIELEFDFDDVSDADVINYLNELIEDGSLSYEIDPDYKSRLDHLQRKVEHGCTDAFCSLCDSTSQSVQ